jgi:hypothetical protein
VQLWPMILHEYFFFIVRFAFKKYIKIIIWKKGKGEERRIRRVREESGNICIENLSLITKTKTIK